MRKIQLARMRSHSDAESSSQEVQNAEDAKCSKERGEGRVSARFLHSGDPKKNMIRNMSNHMVQETCALPPPFARDGGTGQRTKHLSAGLREELPVRYAASFIQ